MPNLVGIGNSQVPTNAMLGGLAYQDPAHANLTEVEIEKIAAIKAKLSETAIDIFVYDTRKDSDGGAWRKRTQHTSWYNELPSHQRGHRKEFPAVAVLVVRDVDPAYGLTIYDGDDPNLPMWMDYPKDTTQDPFFDYSDNGSTHMGNYSPISVSALNGIICVGTWRSAGSLGNLNAGLREFHFIEDECYATNNDKRVRFPTRIADRTVPTPRYYEVQSTPLIDANVLDVAMTVLPNAPTNGLPRPTIAVGTDGGVSVLKPDGTNDISVVDIRRTSDDDVHHVAFDGDRVIMFMELGAIYVATIPSADQSGNPNGAWSVYGTYSANSSGTNYPKVLGNSHGADLVSMKDHIFANAGTNGGDDKYKGLSILAQNVSSSGNGMVAWIKTNFNSGWMHGNCKGAFLSDTDDTNLHKSTLQAAAHATLDSTFATSNGWVINSDWSVSGGVATCNGNNSNVFIYPNANMFAIGTSVVIEVTVTAYTSGTLYVSYGTGNATSGTNMAATGTYYHVHEIDGNQIWYLRSDSFVGSIDNVYAYAAEPDRSENNKGLAVVGTINKTAVATGAELVSYSNFSTSNYLTQPHNSDMQTGTGDFSVSCWFKTTSTVSDYEGLIFYNNAGSIGNGFQLMMNNNGSDKGLYWYIYGAGVDVNSDYVTKVNDGRWHSVVATHTSSKVEMYVDGILKNSKAHSTGSINNSTAQFTVGRWFGNTSSNFYFRGDLALVRHSASIPSAEQVKKMYDDEKHFFQENAKCTLYGSSNAVTAVAYDDSNDILHAGTSGGRSEFVGLNRINNTTTAVTTAISASNGLVAEQ